MGELVDPSQWTVRIGLLRSWEAKKINNFVLTLAEQDQGEYVRLAAHLIFEHRHSTLDVADIEKLMVSAADVCGVFQSVSGVLDVFRALTSEDVNWRVFLLALTGASHDVLLDASKAFAAPSPAGTLAVPKSSTWTYIDRDENALGESLGESLGDYMRHTVNDGLVAELMTRQMPRLIVFSVELLRHFSDAHIKREALVATGAESMVRYYRGYVLPSLAKGQMTFVPSEQSDLFLKLGMNAVRDALLNSLQGQRPMSSRDRAQLSSIVRKLSA